MDSETSSNRGDPLAKGLGVFSVGLGLAQLAAPRAIQRLIGIDDCSRNNVVVRALGAREVAHGVGIGVRRFLSDEVSTAASPRRRRRCRDQTRHE